MAPAPQWLTLEPGEEVVWTGHPRLRRILSTVAMAVVWSTVAVVAGIVAPGYLGLELEPLFIWGAIGLWILFQVAGVFRRYLVTINIEYVMTTENVYKKTGVFSETVTRVGLDKIQNLELSQDFFGNLFDYGTIAISTAGSSGWQMTIDDLDDPDEFRHDLRQRMTRTADRSTRSDRPEVAAMIDDETLERMVEEARKLRHAADRVRQHVSSR